MNSFTLIAVGQLAQDPELEKPKGGTPYTRFALVGNDYAGKGQGEVSTSIYFVAFNGTAETLVKHSRKGDQLIIEAQVRSNNRTDKKTGEVTYDYSYIVRSFRFGAPGKAKREQMDQVA